MWCLEARTPATPGGRCLGTPGCLQGRGRSASACSGCLWGGPCVGWAGLSVGGGRCAPPRGKCGAQLGAALLCQRPFRWQHGGTAACPVGRAPGPSPACLPSPGAPLMAALGPPAPPKTGSWLCLSLKLPCSPGFYFPRPGAPGRPLVSGAGPATWGLGAPAPPRPWASASCSPSSLSRQHYWEGFVRGGTGSGLGWGGGLEGPGSTSF